MGELRLFVPITVRLAGRPGPAELAALTEAVANTVSGRLAEAEAWLARPGGVAGQDPAGLPRWPWIDARFDAAAGTYALPSYQGGGEPTPVPVVGADKAKLVRIDVYLAEGLVVAIREGETPPLVFRLVSTELAAGSSYQWAFRDGQHWVSAGTKDQKVIRFRGRQTDLALLEALVKAAPGPLPARVLESAVVPAATPGAKEDAGGAQMAGTDKGQTTSPLQGDLTVFKNDPALAELYLDFLARFAAVSVPKKEAQAGLTEERVQQLIQGKPRAKAVTLFFTQGWKEWTAAGGTEKLGFAVLEETLLIQWQRGNPTVLSNHLELGKDAEGFGMFRRGTPIKLYDELGQPIPGLGGGYRDSGFRASEPPEFALSVQIDSPGLFQVLRSVQQTFVDQPVLVYKAAKAYVDNGDLVWPALREGWDAWSALEQELQRQVPVLIAFLAGHTVALALKKSGNPYGVAVGAAIDGILWAAGKAFQIIFIGQLLYLAYRAGGELSLVQRPAPGQKLDALSQRHLANAIVILRELVILAVAAGLTALAVKAARETAILLSPPGGGGGPSPAFATSAAGKGGRTSAAAGEATGPPLEAPGFRPAPAQMSSLDKADEANKAAGTPGKAGETQSGQAGGGGGKTPGEPGGPAKKPGGVEEPPAARPQTGAQLEKQELKFHQKTKPATSPTYFSRQKVRFSKLVEDLQAYRASQTKAGNPDPVASLNDKVLGETAHKFLDGRPRLKAFLEGQSKSVAERLVALNKELSRTPKNDGGRKPLEERIRHLEKELAEITAFEQGEVGAKEMDLVELFPAERRIVVTDITQKLVDPFHNFKTEFYVEVLKALTGWSEVYGVEFKNVGEQKVTP